LQLDQASLGLSREYLTKGFSEKLVDAYYKYLVDIAVTLGAKRDHAVKEIRDSIEFEMKLANVSVHPPMAWSYLTLCPAKNYKIYNLSLYIWAILPLAFYGFET
jgi:hypothetical protein